MAVTAQAPQTSRIQYVSDADGNPVGVIVPIDVWRKIESERETAYLLSSEAMRKRLLEAKERTEGIPLEEVRVLEFDPAAFEDLAWWVQQDRKKTLTIRSAESAGPNRSSTSCRAAGQNALVMSTVLYIRC